MLYRTHPIGSLLHTSRRATSMLVLHLAATIDSTDAAGGRSPYPLGASDREEERAEERSSGGRTLLWGNGNPNGNTVSGVTGCGSAGLRRHLAASQRGAASASGGFARFGRGRGVDEVLRRMDDVLGGVPHRVNASPRVVCHLV